MALRLGGKMNKFSEKLAFYVKKLETMGIKRATIAKQVGLDLATLRDWTVKGYIPRNKDRAKKLVEYIENELKVATNLMDLYTQVKGKEEEKTPLLKAYLELKSKNPDFGIEDIAKAINRTVPTVKGIIYGRIPGSNSTYTKIANFFNEKLNRNVVPIERKVSKSFTLLYREAKEKHNLKFKDIAKEIGISTSLLGRWVYEGIVPKSEKILRRAAKFFSEKLGREVTMAYLSGKEVKEEAVERIAYRDTYRDKIVALIKELENLMTETVEWLPEDEKELIANYRKLDAQGKKEITEFIKFKLERR